ncbi:MULTISPECIES: hypothetical protein [Nocardia]|uniref:hypothetical protein n=1 Tax=Nocardia TaxID=1817 RepID=UPI002453E1E0|nr:MULTISPECIES: hypothetical protein [Nocardia]
MAGYAQGGVIHGSTVAPDSVPVWLDGGCGYRLSEGEARVLSDRVLERINDGETIPEES